MISFGPSTMTDQRCTEEVTIQCTQCGAVYPALRLAGGKLTRDCNQSVCRCGNKSFTELNSAD